MHTDSSYALPRGVSRLNNPKEIIRARQERQCRAAGKTPEEWTIESRASSDEQKENEAASFHQDVIIPDTRTSMPTRFEEFQMFCDFREREGKRKRVEKDDDDDVVVIYSNPKRSSSSSSRQNIACADTNAYSNNRCQACNMSPFCLSCEKIMWG